MTENSKKILDFLKEHYGEEMTKHKIVEALDVPLIAVTGAMRGLLKEARVTERVEEVPTEEGKKPREMRYYTLTEAGLAFDPVAHEEAVSLAKKEATAAKKAAKLAAKNAQ